MNTSRQRVIEYLKSKGPVSAQETARALHVTPANIRHHIAALIRDGVVQVVGLKPTAGRGRPCQVYRLIQQASENNLPRLSSALLDELFITCSPEQIESRMQSLAARLAPSEHAQGTLQQLIHAAVAHLNRNHYQARWEARAVGPRIILMHCPYAAILQDHPLLCQMDKVLLEKMLLVPATQVAKLEITAPGMARCIFELNISHR